MQSLFDDLTQLAERMTETLRIPFKLDHGDVRVTASIGIVIDAGEQDVDALLNNADKAMYAAKSRGKQCAIRVL
ncbi:MAG: diguanylate cyclase [Candidatus Competibacteraceae bacterium]